MIYFFHLGQRKCIIINIKIISHKVRYLLYKNNQPRFLTFFFSKIVKNKIKIDDVLIKS